MKRTAKKRKRVLEHQTVKRKGQLHLISLPLRALWPCVKGIWGLFIVVTVVILVSFSFLYVYHYLLTSPYLDLEYVEIRGVEDSLKPELSALGELRPGKSLLALNLHALKRKLEKHPWIRSVQLERKFPDTLLVRAEKQEPWAILPLGTMYYVNRYGKVFKKIGKSENMDLPVITGLRGKEEKGSKLPLQSVMKGMEVLNRERPGTVFRGPLCADQADFE